MVMLKLHKCREFPGWEYGGKSIQDREKSVKFSGNCQEYSLTKVKLHAGKYQEMT